MLAARARLAWLRHLRVRHHGHVRRLVQCRRVEPLPADEQHCAVRCAVHPGLWRPGRQHQKLDAGAVRRVLPAQRRALVGSLLFSLLFVLRGREAGREDAGAQPLNRTPFCATACAATRLPTRASAAVSLLARGARGISGKKRCTNLLGRCPRSRPALGHHHHHRSHPCSLSVWQVPVHSDRAPPRRGVPVVLELGALLTRRCRGQRVIRRRSRGHAEMPGRVRSLGPRGAVEDAGGAGPAAYASRADAGRVRQAAALADRPVMGVVRHAPLTVGRLVGPPLTPTPPRHPPSTPWLYNSGQWQPQGFHLCEQRNPWCSTGTPNSAESAVQGQHEKERCPW